MFRGVVRFFRPQLPHCGSRRTMAASADAEMAEVARREYAEVMGALPGLPSLMTATRRKPEEDKDKEEDRQSKYPRPGTEASKGQGQRRGKGNWSRNSWDSANWSRSSGWGDQGEKENKQLSEPDYATQALLRSMTKLVICHEEELARLRVDTSWMLFVDTHEEGIVPLLQQAAEQWQIKCEAREVTTGLRVVLFLALINEAKRRLELMLEPEQQQRATNVGWMGQGSTALAPVWYYHVWNPERMQQERSDRQPLCHQTATDAAGLQCLPQCPHPLQGDSRTGGGAHQPGGPVHAIPVASERGHSPMSSSPRRTGWKRVPEALGNTPPARKRPAIPTVSGAGRPLPQALLHGLDGAAQSAGAEEALAAPNDAGDRRTVNQAARRVICQLECPSPQTPQAKLQNPHSLCYINSVAQSLAWQGRMSSAPLLCYGQAHIALQMVLRPGTPTLHRSLPWLPYVQTWRQVAQQHDASEYLQHFLSIAQPPAYNGHWEARMSNPHQVTDGGALQSPLLLEACGPDLQAAVDTWHAQPALHALCMHTGLVLLQLKRYSYQDGCSCKNQVSILCRPGAVIRVPHFTASAGIQVRHDKFRVAFVIFRHR